MAITLDGLTGVTAPSVTATGNISGTYILGNGYFLTNVTGGSSYGDANVAAYLPTYTGNLVSLTGNIITTANITAAYVLPQSNATTDLGSNTLQWRSLYVSNNTIYIGGTSVGVADGQLTVAGNTVVTEGTSLAGNIDTTGNISAGNIAVTSLITTDNLNVGTLLDVKDVNLTGQVLTDINLAGNVNPGNVNALGNVSGQYLNVSANVNAGNLQVTHNAVILGNLRVEGTTTEINVANIFLADTLRY